MSSVAQVTIQADKPRQSSKCTPHLPGWPYHIHYTDFEAICDGNASDADALRGFEYKTDRLIEELRYWQGLPSDILPDEDDLWFEASGYSLESWTHRAYGHATYDYSIARLIDRGFLRRRFVARSGYSQDGPQIIVDEDGNYTDAQGKQRNAIDEGYRLIRRQYLYCIDAVNAALARLAGQSPPIPMQRKKKSAATSAGTTKSLSDRSAKNDHGFSRLNTAPQGELKDSDVLFSTENNTSSDTLSLKIAENPLRGLASSDLRRAAWTAETVIALAARRLVIPADDGSEEWQRDWLAPAQWLIEQTIDLDPSRAWERIECHIGAMISGPTWHARHAARPFTAATLTLRHVVGTKKGTQTLDGHAWRSTAEALRKEPWAVEVHIDYFGPSLFVDSSQPAQSSYAQGYAGTQSEQTSSAACEESAHVVEVVVQASQIDERATKPLCAEDAQSAHDDPAHVVVVEGSAQIVHDDAQPASVAVAQPPVEPLVVSEQQGDGEVTQGIAQPGRGRPIRTELAARLLAGKISNEHPGIIAYALQLGACYVVALETAQGQQYYIETAWQYIAPTATTQLALSAAQAYGREQRQAAQSNDAHGPPGDAQMSEEGGEQR